MSSLISGSGTPEEGRLATGREAKHVVPTDKTAVEAGSLLYLKEWNDVGLLILRNQVMYDLVEKSGIEAGKVGGVKSDSQNY